MPLDLRPLDIGGLPEHVVRVVGPDAAFQAKMMAARGLVPFGPKDLVTALYQLSFDTASEVSKAATARVKELPDNILGPALESDLDPMVLDWYSAQVVRKGPLIEKILLNNRTHDETFLTLARRLRDRELEILAGNQARLLRFPAIIEALYFNRNARMSTVQRLVELAARNGLTLEKIPHFAELARDIMGDAAPEAPPAQPVPVEPPPTDEGPPDDDELYEGAQLGSPLMSGADVALDTAFHTAMVEWADEDDEDFGEDWEEEALDELDDENEVSDVDLANLPINAKIRLATIGTISHRRAMIKDSNKMVAMAAIGSPGVTETEAAKYAANRSLHEDVIRFISVKKEWQKNYMVKLNLITNPKCPLAYSMRTLIYLRQSDVKSLAKSKAIPTALRQAAERLGKKRSH